MPIRPAILADIPQLLPLINSAFRGETSKQGWTHEADLIEGAVRTDEETLRQILLAPEDVLLQYSDEAGHVQACVSLQKKERGLYLGMLTVMPELQGAGIGQQLLAAAEDFAQQQHCPGIFMTVISVRTELIAWYERHGYRQTGEIRPFSVEAKFGVPTQPLEFIILEKLIASSSLP